MDGLILKQVALHLQKRKLFELSFTVGPGERLSIMGPSGAGKSALLAFISGTLDEAFEASGEVWLNGQKLNDLKPEARRVGVLFQDDLLFPHLTLAGNLAFGLARGQPQARIDEALELCGLAQQGGRDVASLSGGQRGRACIMRVLLSDPQVLVLDEPFANLDEKTRAMMREFVFLETFKRKIPLLMVTHDEADAKAAGGRIIRIGE